ncbi:kinase-like domain-containing protein [Rhizophagus irregularis DAOM 181602=DAOM 197198]|nr:kinase-like domain-containing protein [Rhizophagus irregularis DAOM 181602=DAOM 197198]
MELKRVSKRNIILKSLHYNICNLQNTINKFLNKVNTYTGNSKIYGISQNPDTNDYIIIFQETYCAEYGIKYCEKCDEKYTDTKYKWCKSCQINNFKKNFIDWTNGNKQINDFIQELQLRINNWNDTVFEWIPYSKFSNIKEIGKSGYSSIYSAIWKDGPLYYDHKNSKEWIRKSDKKVVLKCLMTSEFLNVVKAYLADKDRIILKVYGISQNPDTKDYVIVLHNSKGGFATVYSAIWEDGPLYFDDNKKEWTREMNKKVALKCLRSSRNINERFLNEAKEYSIDSLNILRIYGISQNPDTKNYIMILQYAEGATERQPFANRAHDEFLALDICEGVRPEINKLKAPKFYIELMNKCWDLNPNKRPNATEISDQISLWKNDDFEHVENYRKANLFKRDQLINHPQAIYTSRILNPYTKNLSKYYNSNCSECAIVD